jgi:hypothetical protein
VGKGRLREGGINFEKGAFWFVYNINLNMSKNKITIISRNEY